MGWTVKFCEEFEPEFEILPEKVQDELLAKAGLLEECGPMLKRPNVDTLNNSQHANMKELRFKEADRVWRVAFAFDTQRQAILLVAGDKSGLSEKLFYRELVKKADKRFDAYLNRIQQEEA
jgi:hypothetical protein